MKAVAWNKVFSQLTAASGAMLLIIQTGIIDGWSSPNLAQLTERNATIYLTSSEASWLASCLKLGRFVSIILVAVFMELAGSKKTVLFTFIPVGVAWVLMMTAKTAMFLYVARFLSGISYGLAYGAYSIYLGEIATPKLRGTFTAVALVGWPMGTLAGTVGETYLPKLLSSAIYLMLCSLGIFLFSWFPETPYQLVKDRDLVKARESLRWYRGDDYAETEMDEIIDFVEATGRVTFAEKMKQLRMPKNRNAVILVGMTFVYSQLSGTFNILYYMQSMLTNSQSHLVDPSDMVTYTNAILVVTSIASVNLTDKLGRRILLLFSCVLMSTAMFGLAVHFYLLNNVDPVAIEWIPIASVLILLVAYTDGFSPAMNSLFGEIFPASIKNIAATIITSLAAVSGFASTKAYQPLLDAMGETHVYFMYSIVTASAVPVVLILLSETKGKSLQGIQNVLSKK